MRVNGEIKFFNANRGFGFIKRDDGGDDVFVHVTALTKSKVGEVAEGTKLSFELEPKGEKVRAVNLKRL
jgi:CspA family cold shock protein